MSLDFCGITALTISTLQNAFPRTGGELCALYHWVSSIMTFKG